MHMIGGISQFWEFWECLESKLGVRSCRPFCFKFSRPFHCYERLEIGIKIFLEFVWLYLAFTRLLSNSYFFTLWSLQGGTGCRTGSTVRASATDGCLAGFQELSTAWFTWVLHAVIYPFCSSKDRIFAFLMFCTYTCLGAFTSWNSCPVFICIRVYRQPVRIK